MGTREPRAAPRLGLISSWAVGGAAAVLVGTAITEALGSPKLIPVRPVGGADGTGGGATARAVCGMASDLRIAGLGVASHNTP